MSYVDFLNVTEDRQRQLKMHYFFDCTCEHCKGHIKDDLKMGGKEVDGVKVGACECEIHPCMSFKFDQQISHWVQIMTYYDRIK